MKLNIKDQVDKLDISKNKLAQQLGISYPTMLDMYSGESTSIKLDTLEKLCHILQCTPNDILIFDNTKLLPATIPDPLQYVTLYIDNTLLETINKSRNLKLDIKTDPNGKKEAHLIFDVPGENQA